MKAIPYTQVQIIERETVKFGDNTFDGFISDKGGVELGTMIALAGTSGAGKTTLLKLLSGIQEPTSGKIIRPNFFTGNNKKNLYISNVFQDLRLMGKYTCEENLMFAYDSSVYNSKNEFIHFLNIATGSAFELETQINVSKDLEYITEEKENEIIADLHIIQKMLYRLIQSINK